MTNIESNKINIKRDDISIFNFLANFTNFNSLMPSQIEEWTADADTCSFRVQGMPSISLKIEERTEYSEIRIVSDTNSPANFTLFCLLNKIDNENTEVQIKISADLPPMIKMVAKKPLQNFVDVLVQQLKEYAENNKF